VNPPKFARMLGEFNSCCFRLKEDNEYWRDSGAWGFQYKVIAGELFSDMYSFPNQVTFDRLTNNTIIEVTEKEWLNDNSMRDLPIELKNKYTENPI
jgi:hypothetical protein